MTTLGQVAVPGCVDVVNRHKDDFYITPQWVTLALVPHLAPPRDVLDVGCGTGAIGRALRQAWPECWLAGVERDADRAAHARDAGVYNQVWGESWFDDGAWLCDRVPVAPFELIVSNPPFRHALQCLELALARRHPLGTVAFLLPAQWDQETNACAEGVKRERGRFLDRLQVRRDGRLGEGYGKYTIEGRIDFKGDGKTDRIAYAWFVIGPGHEGVHRRIPVYEPCARKQLVLRGA